MNNDNEIRKEIVDLPMEYKILEYRLYINKKLLDENIIDNDIFLLVERSIMGRLSKIRNGY